MSSPFLSLAAPAAIRALASASVPASVVPVSVVPASVVPVSVVPVSVVPVSVVPASVVSVIGSVRRRDRRYLAVETGSAPSRLLDRHGPSLGTDRAGV
jgi:hypothetical protein